MKLVTKMLTAVAICALAVGVADAQGRRGGAGGAGGAGGGQGRGGMMGGGTGPIQLVVNAAVLEDIKATDEQKTKLADWAKEAGPKFQATVREKMMDVPMEEQMQKRGAIVAELNKGLWKEIDTALKPAQTTRVKQIYVQALGIRAFTDAEVVEKLKLSDEQKEKIKAISDEFNTKAGEIRRSGRGGEEELVAFQGRGGAGGGQGRGGALSPELQKKLDDLTKETMTKIKDLLKDDQKKAWADLTGKEFDVAKLRPAPRGQ